MTEYASRPITVGFQPEFDYLVDLVAEVAATEGDAWNSTVGAVHYFWTEFYGVRNGDVFTFTRGQNGPG